MTFSHTREHYTGKIITSPLSVPNGSYQDIQDPHIQTLSPHLHEDEYVVPIIGEANINEGIQWLSNALVTQVIIPALEKSRLIVVIYNLYGAEFFFNKLQPMLTSNLASHSISDSVITYHPIRVTSATGYQQFGPVRLELWPSNLENLNNTVVISLDDMGDTGTTQLEVERLSWQRGAVDVVKVNLFEKLLSPETKRDVPEYAVFLLQIFFAIGCGLDSGTENVDREAAFRAYSTLLKLAQQS